MCNLRVVCHLPVVQIPPTYCHWHIVHSPPAIASHQCRYNSPRRGRTNVRATATQPIYASHPPISSPNWEIRPVWVAIERAALRVGNHLRHVWPNSFSCRSWIDACYASPLAVMFHATLWCMIWSFRYFARMSMFDHWPVRERRRRSNRRDRQLSFYSVGDLLQKKE